MKHKLKRIFVDTNILVYAHDLEAGQKHELARDKVLALWNGLFQPLISIQVLQEFYVNLIKKKIPDGKAKEAVEDYMAWEPIENDHVLLLAGMRMRERWKVSFWDGLILAAAKKGECDSLWSEDFNSRQYYDGIEVINPFTQKGEDWSSKK